MSKEEFSIVINFKGNSYTAEVSECNFLWTDLCSEVIKLDALLCKDEDCATADLDIDFNDSDFSNLPDFITKYVDGDPDRWDELFEVWYDSDFYLDLEVLEAGIELDIELKNIAEAYSGQYNSDADFAEQLTKECYDLKFEPSWLVIDWEETAANLMYDFTESNGYYFNNCY